MSPSEEAAPRPTLDALDGATSHPLLDPAYRRRKFVLWTIRQVITVGLAYWFWELWWVRWLFALAVVLALFNLGLLLFAGPYLKRRSERIRARFLEQEAIWEAEDAMDEDTEKDERP
jgi:hypothetical protein